MRRMDQIERLQREEFDLCIIGGGAAGAGAALDAALRGLKVALIEKSDFAGETSSKSTKLIHGGVRYLEQAFKRLDFAQLRQVRHGLEERHIVLQNAPNLAHPLGLITPVFSWWEGLYFYIGLKIYDWFASKKDHLPSSRWLSKKETLHMMPGISNHIHSAVLYYDGQLDDARYCLALVQSAAKAGAVVANYLEVTAFQKNTHGKIDNLRVEEKSIPGSSGTFTIRAKYFLNCCGPHADNIRLMANSRLQPRIQASKGVHLVLPIRYFKSEYAMLIPKTKDGRVVFAIPFEGYLLLGTTDDPCTSVEKEPLLESAEADFLLETLQPFVKEPIPKREIKAGFGGLRPLVASDSAQHKTGTKTLLRDHVLEYDAESGLVSLMGGKWTTYRLMAKDAIDFIAQKLANTTPCSTDGHFLQGSEHWDQGFWKKIASVYPFDADVSQHLAAKYGRQAEQIVQMVQQKPELADRILPGFPFIKAEVAYAAESEMALHIRDVLARRMRLEMVDWEAAKTAAPVVASVLADSLGWSASESIKQLGNYIAMIEAFQRNIKS